LAFGPEARRLNAAKSAGKREFVGSLALAATPTVRTHSAIGISEKAFST
jgi:hypothetical protein